MSDSIIQNVSRHISLTEDEQGLFIALLTQKTLKKKEHLLRAGDISRHLSYVSKGCLRIYTVDDTGKEHILHFTPDDWWCNDTRSYYLNTFSTYNIEALEDTDVLQITRDNLEKLFETVPKFERFFRILVTNGFIWYQQRMAIELTLTAQQRYNNFKATYPTLEQRISQKHIAAYLGITPVFLSILRKRKN